MHTLTFTDSASRPGQLTHEGPLADALAYFHGEIGPRWPAVLDGRQGSFTVENGVVRFDDGRPGGLPGDVGIDEAMAQPIRR